MLGKLVDPMKDPVGKASSDDRLDKDNLPYKVGWRYTRSRGIKGRY